MKNPTPQQRTTIRQLGTNNQAILRCGMTTQRPAGTQLNFVTSEYVMLYMVNGRAQYQDASHAKVLLQQGDVWQRFPDVPHSVVCLESCCWCFVAVPASILGLLELMELPTLHQIVFHVGHHRQISHRFEKLRQRLATCTHKHRPDCLLSMQQLMIDLHRMASPQQAQCPAWLDDAKQILSENLQKRLKTQDVAQKLQLSVTSFRRHFTQATGISPGQFRIQQRIEQAQERLAGTSQTITYIANELGYPDVYCFSTQFTRFTGTPPGQYRKQWQWETQTT